MSFRDLLGRHFHILNLTQRRRNWQSVVKQAFDMKRNRFPNFGFDFGNSRTRSYAARKIGRVGGAIVFSGFDNDGVAQIHVVSRIASRIWLAAFLLVRLALPIITISVFLSMLSVSPKAETQDGRCRSSVSHPA